MMHEQAGDTKWKAESAFRTTDLLVQHLPRKFENRPPRPTIQNCLRLLCDLQANPFVALELPSSKSGLKVPRKDVDAVENSFPGLIGLLWQHAGSRLTGIDDADIEHYHRIRNKLYHDGTGLSVDEHYHRHTFFWEDAKQAGVITGDDIRRLTELRMIRNTQGPLVGR